jgi:hypothetical protein
MDFYHIELMSKMARQMRFPRENSSSMDISLEYEDPSKVAQ